MTPHAYGLPKSHCGNDDTDSCQLNRHRAAIGGGAGPAAGRRLVRQPAANRIFREKQNVNADASGWR
jgi:hypothetical protein